MGLGWGLRFLISNKLPGDACAAGPLTTLCIIRVLGIQIFLCMIQSSIQMSRNPEQNKIATTIHLNNVNKCYFGAFERWHPGAIFSSRGLNIHCAPGVRNLQSRKKYRTESPPSITLLFIKEMSQIKQPKNKSVLVRTSVQYLSAFTKGHRKAWIGLRPRSLAGVHTLFLCSLVTHSNSCSPLRRPE